MISGRFGPGGEYLKELLDQQIFVREGVTLQFGVDLRVILENLKPPVVEGHEFERFDPLLARNQQLLRQTDGSRFVVSLRAIFNSDFHKDLALQRDLPFSHHSA